ncbi:MAG: septum formation protein Maf [Deltaproteobacteria bacterium]|nr:MAG: septum formation protein Maf [Deltaproteobacteria bacterium]
MLVLASSSPRRRQLLEQVGVQFAVDPCHSEPAADASAPAEEATTQAATHKAGRVAGRHHAWVLGADTVVSCGGKLLGKPADDAQAAAMLRRLSGRSHRVVSAVVLLQPGGQAYARRVVSSRVTFRELDEEWIAWYLASGEPFDKAGAYGIQGRAAALVRAVEGSYTNVVGLPLAETLDILRQAGLWRPAAVPATAPAPGPGGER